MAEYIDLEAFKHKLIDEKKFFPAIVARALHEMPAADVVEVKHGYWYFTEYEYFTCSVCGKSHWNFCDTSAEARNKLRSGECYPFCPECGAKMDGERKEK